MKKDRCPNVFTEVIGRDDVYNLFPANRVLTKNKIFRFAAGMSCAEAIAQMDAKGYMQANSHELLSWGDKSWNKEVSVVALGEKTSSNKVVVLDKCNKSIILLSLSVINTILHDFYLLGVKE